MRHITFALVALSLVALSSGCRPDRAEFSALKDRVEALESAAGVVKTRQVQIVDEKGKVHAYLGLREDGSPELRMVDEEDKNRLLARLHPDGTPIFVLWGKGGKGTSYLSVPGEGPPNLMFFDGEGTIRHQVPKK